MILTKFQATYLTVFIFYMLFVPTSNFGIYASVSSILSKSWRKIDNGTTSNDYNSTKYIKKQINYVFYTFQKVTDLVENFYYMTDVIDAIEETEYIVSNKLAEVKKMKEIREYKSMIMSRYKTVEQYYENISTLETSTLLSFAESTVFSLDTISLREYVQKIHYSLFGAEDEENKAAKSFEELAINFKSSNDRSCRKQQSAQQYLYSFYNDIVRTELKGIILLDFSWMILRVLGKGNFTAQANLAKRQHQERMKRTVRYLRKALSTSDRVIWQCDPSEHIEATTYASINKPVEPYYRYVPEGYSCTSTHFCGEPPTCNGTINSCKERKSDRTITVTIKGKDVHSTTITPCILCACTCELKGNEYKGDCLFSLRTSVADVKNNMVVTGLRLRKIQRMFYIQIQQGKLLPRGTIDSSTLEWLPLDIINLNTAEKNIDYFELTSWSRGLQLDNVGTELISFVVTGVRIIISSKTDMVLDVGFNEFNFETGKLLSTDEVSMWRNRVPCNLKVLNAWGKSSPSPSKSFPQSTARSFIKFELDNRIPLVDLQDVVSNPPVPLEGAGFYYKYRYGYGGHVALKLFTLNLNNYPLPDLSKKNDELINTY